MPKPKLVTKIYYTDNKNRKKNLIINGCLLPEVNRFCFAEKDDSPIEQAGRPVRNIKESELVIFTDYEGNVVEINLTLWL